MTLDRKRIALGAGDDLERSEGERQAGAETVGEEVQGSARPLVKIGPNWRGRRRGLRAEPSSRTLGGTNEK